VVAAAAAAALWLGTPAAAHPPYALVADRSGNLYFSDLETVWRLDPDDRLSVFRPRVPDTHVHELVIARDGALEGDQTRYDPATRIFFSGLWRRRPGGTESWIVAPKAAPPRGMGLWQDRAGNRYTAQWPSQENRRTLLFRRSPGGRVERLFGSAADAIRFRQTGVGSVGAMAFMPDGSLVFADGRALRRMAPTGDAALLWQGPKGTSLRGLALLPDGRVLAADSGGKAVLAIDPDGRARTLYRERQEWLPTAAAMSRGRLLVLEANAEPREYVNRVRVVDVTDGRPKVVAAPGATPHPTGAAAPSPGVEQRPGVPLAWLGGGAVAVAAAAAAMLTLRRRRSD
jgi:sugar lactone lactonase YvrE